MWQRKLLRLALELGRQLDRLLAGSSKHLLNFKNKEA
jgi:hypothetical protein